MNSTVAPSDVAQSSSTTSTKPRTLHAARLTTTDELMAAFRLRAQVYRESNLAAFLNDEESGIDVDAFDEYSTHIGLFVDDELVGAMRVVHYENVVSGKKVHDLALNETCEAALPMLKFSPYHSQLTQLAQQKSATGAEVVEASRFAILKPYQGLRAGKTLIEGAIDFVNRSFERPTVLAIVNRHHVPVYRRYNLTPLKGLIEYENEGNSCVTITGEPRLTRK